MSLQTLRTNRAVILASEAIGWVHMAGKAHPDFLRGHGGQSNGYDFKQWASSLSPDWNTRFAWLSSAHKRLKWPSSLAELLRAFDDGKSAESVLGLLQAAHAMASGIEKNHPRSTSKYLGQDITHMWRTSPFGHPERNLLVDPPAILQPGGADALRAEIGRVLDELRGLVTVPTPDVEPWARWRANAIGPASLIRRSFLETLAETRVPNNDVTLWDQSYVAAALFKSAVAGAILASGTNCQNWQNLKQETQWRVLTVGIGAEHYESRAVRIGDWTGARAELDAFFDDVCRLVEVDVALGSVLYRDGGVMAFTFPGLRDGATKTDTKRSLSDDDARSLRDELARAIDELAKARHFETPPLVRLSETSTRSFIAMAKELDSARRELTTPLNRPWDIAGDASDKQHTCPVCLVRGSGSGDKQKPCKVCRDRRSGRLNAWLDDKVDQNTIWVSEVADHNDRVALLSFSLGLDGWLDARHIDSLRAQSIPMWRHFNGQLGSVPDPVDGQEADRLLKQALASRVSQEFNKRDTLLKHLQDGYQYEKSWESFFAKVVEDRSDAPQWTALTHDQRAAWLAHQLFRKHASPGRVHRFWRASEAFFQRLLSDIRERAAQHPNRWRTRRLVLKAQGGTWTDRETYHGVWRDAPLGLVYRRASDDFITITNLARCFAPTAAHSALNGQTIEVVGDDTSTRTRLVIERVDEKLGSLGAYHPIIPIDLDPQRFRVLVPLEAVDDVLAAAHAQWEEAFARVWDRLPLYAGVVAFPRMTPFQAVIEAARNLEDALTTAPSETWRVAEASRRGGVCATRWVRADGEQALTTTPTRLPDGRDDDYYPYLAVEDRPPRNPRDFQHPRGQVYRHVADLRPGDGATVHPSRCAAVFLDSTAPRFDTPEVYYLMELRERAALWALICDLAPSTSALRAALRCIEDARERWIGAPAGAVATWLEFARAVLHDQLGARGAALDALVDAARTGLLVRTLRWHLQIQKHDLEPNSPGARS